MIFIVYVECAICVQTKEQGDSERLHLRSEVERLTGKLEDVREKLADAQAQQRVTAERAEKAEAASHLAQATLSASRGDAGDLSRTKVHTGQ